MEQTSVALKIERKWIIINQMDFASTFAPSEQKTQCVEHPEMSTPDTKKQISFENLLNLQKSGMELFNLRRLPPPHPDLSGSSAVHSSPWCSLLHAASHAGCSS